MNDAEQRINEVLINKSIGLNLNSLGLTSLPDSFLSIASQIETLTLVDNGFINFPRELKACSNLKVLIFDKNKLSNLDGISSLQKLDNLSVNDNELTYFPTDILELKNMEVLYMNNNSMTSIPQGILELKKLQGFSAKDNFIEILPSEIAQLPDLKNIYLSGNPLKTPPIEIAYRGIESIRAYFEDLSKNKGKDGKNILFTIAIDQYKDKKFSPQKGRVADAQGLAEVLSNKYDYQPIELYNKSATANNILGKLNAIVDDSKQNDSVIIFFNSQISDAFGYGYFSYEKVKIEENKLFAAISKMSAQHVLLIIDFHYYTDRGTTTRGVSLEKGTYSSRWIMHRQTSEWSDRFTPQLIKFLKTLNFEVGVQELLTVIKDVVIAPLNLGGDEGGMFNFIPINLNDRDDFKDRQIDANVSNVEVERLKDNLREHISTAQLKKLFDEINIQISTNSNAYNDLILLSGRFNSNARRNNQGLLTSSDYNIELNRINNSVLSVINQLEIEDFKADYIRSIKNGNADYINTNKEVYKDINKRIGYVEKLRKKYLDTNSINEKSEILKEIETALKEIDVLRTTTSEYRPPEAFEEDSLKFLSEEKLWQNALSNSSLQAFQKYIDETVEGTYRQEASAAIHELELENEESSLFEKIEKQKDITLINIYRSKFPKGKYLNPVESILDVITKEEEALWNKAQLQNTIESFNNYIDTSKLRTYEKNAVKLKNRLEGEGSATRINEAKLILVGNGRVGKTSLTRRLMSDEFDPKEESTHGIRIEKWPLKLEDGRTIQVNVWDFGGQEIYHNTHRFFLTNRALYIIVWDLETQKEAQEHPEKQENFVFDYWLENVSSLSEESPVLLVQNKIEEGIDPSFILNSLPDNKSWNIKDKLAVSAAEGLKIVELKESIMEQFQHAPKLKNLIGFDLGEGWSNVRIELEKLAIKQPYIKFDEYLNICKKQDINSTNAEGLSQFLTDIGVIIHFPDNPTLKEMVILDPRWTTKIIYRFLNEEIKMNHGQFKKSELSVNMKKKEAEKFSKKFRFREEREIQIFLELMSKFEICFELPDKGVFIAPQFLSDTKPVFGWDSTKSIKYGYKFNFLHQGIIARTIVKLHKLAIDDSWWRNGILMKKEDVRIKIESLPKLNELRIEMIGEKADQVRDIFLDDVFDEINLKMKAKAIRYCPEVGCNCIFNEEIIYKLRDENQSYITCPESNNNVLIDDILGKNINNMKVPKVFISYSHDDEDYKEILQKWLKSLQYTLDIDVWEDRQIKLGADWRDKISTAMEQAEFIILLVTTEFLASDFIKNIEVKRAFERHKKGEAVVLPIIVKPCAWKQKPIKDVQVAPKDGKPITKYDNQDEAWLEVLERIQERLEE